MRKLLDKDQFPPIVLESIIRKTKPSSLVKNENIVIRTTVLNKDFISSPHICY